MRGHPYIVVIILLFLALVGAGYFFVLPSKPQPTPEQQARADVQYYFSALARKDWKEVCGHLTLAAQQKLSGPETTCAQQLQNQALVLQNRLALAGKQSKIVSVRLRGAGGIVAARRGEIVSQNRVVLVGDNWVIDNPS